jgi:diaminopimelate epimerase
MVKKLKVETSLTNDVRFTKVSGAGNDFILFDTLNHVVPMLSQEAIQKLCTRGLNVGADGILILSPSQKADFKLHYFNADGTSGMLCANAARCAVIYAKKYFDMIEDEISFECCGEIFSGRIVGRNLVEFYLNDVTSLHETAAVIDDYELSLFYADTGAPHVVVEFSDLPEDYCVSASFDDFDINFIGKKIRNHSAFAPEGVNVNFLSVEEEKIKIRSFERGVEGETLACGTGIVAAALYLSEKKGIASPLEIVSRSGKTFTVKFKKTEKGYTNISLIGEARIVYYGEILEGDVF